MADASDGSATTEAFTFPNKMGRIVYQSLEEAMGSTALAGVLALARIQQRAESYPPNNFDREFAFDELGRLLQALDEMYGARSGRGLARRAGRTCFTLGVKDFGAMLSVADVALRVLPLGLKLRVGIEVLSETFNRFTDHRVVVSEDEQYFVWSTQRCGICWGRHADAPCCHLAVGVLEEGLYWVSGGQSFYVEEVACVAAGDESCAIQIAKRPLD